jgi:ubiquinone/menaquinone biosynthesis C-methylase UbiE
MVEIMGQSEEIIHTKGHVIHWANRYDRLVKVLMLGKEDAIRKTTLQRAEVSAGEKVLDVGCGTGSLTVMAKRTVGPTGEVCGIDPAPEMIELARHKAAGAGVDVAFQVGTIEALPFPGGDFDVVLSSLMVHHLPDDLKTAGFREIHRVLKQGGRFLIVDIEPSGLPLLGALFTHLIGHGRMRGNITRLPKMLREAGFSRVETGGTAFSPLSFALAAREEA